MENISILQTERKRSRESLYDINPRRYIQRSRFWDDEAKTFYGIRCLTGFWKSSGDGRIPGAIGNTTRIPTIYGLAEKGKWRSCEKSQSFAFLLSVWVDLGWKSKQDDRKTGDW